MYKIGDFSYIVNLPVATIKMYDELGVLCPSIYDFNTGYSYYTATNIKQCKFIQQLLLAGLTLDEIKKNKSFSDIQLLEKKRELLKLNPVPTNEVKELDKLRSRIIEGRNYD